MAKVVIIGAGLTGISTAYHLEQAGFTDYKLYEKEATAGGLCRSIYQDGFTFDYTGHLLHSNNPYFTTFLHETIGIDTFNTVNRKSFIYSHNTYTHFPFQSNLYGLPETVIAECIEGFVSKPKTLKKNANFYDWALHMFGKGITEQFFVPYQQKIFDYDIHKLSSSWTGRFVPKTTLTDIIKGALRPPLQQEAGYNANFLYPKSGGIYFWVQRLIQKLKKPIKTQYCVDSIDLTNKIVTFTNGDFEHFDELITTMPLDILLTLIKEPAESSVKKAGKKLLCNSVANFNLGIQNPNLTDKHWIYLPETQFPHYRIGFYHNFSSSMAPEGCSSLYGEYAYLKKEKSEVKNTIDTAIASTKKLLNISDAQVITQRVVHIPHAYVIYNPWREKNLPAILEHLTSYNVHSIGRYGAWKYSSMQEAVLDGKAMAESLLIEKSSLKSTYVPQSPKEERI